MHESNFVNCGVLICPIEERNQHASSSIDKGSMPTFTAISLRPKRLSLLRLKLRCMAHMNQCPSYLAFSFSGLLCHHFQSNSLIQQHYVRWKSQESPIGLVVVGPSDQKHRSGHTFALCHNSEAQRAQNRGTVRYQS